MRLIDADRLNNVIERSFCYPSAMKQIVDIQPTAYDVNKVVEQLEKRRDNVVKNIELNSQSDDLRDEVLRTKNHYDSIIKTVKSGGKE